MPRLLAASAIRRSKFEIFLDTKQLLQLYKAIVSAPPFQAPPARRRRPARRNVFRAPGLPKSEQGVGLMTTRRRARLELMLEAQSAIDATSKRLQRDQQVVGADAVKRTVRAPSDPHSARVQCTCSTLRPIPSSTPPLLALRTPKWHFFAHWKLPRGLVETARKLTHVPRAPAGGEHHQDGLSGKLRARRRWGPKPTSHTVNAKRIYYDCAEASLSGLAGYSVSHVPCVSCCHKLFTTDHRAPRHSHGERLPAPSAISSGQTLIEIESVFMCVELVGSLAYGAPGLRGLPLSCLWTDRKPPRPDQLWTAHAAAARPHTACFAKLAL